MKCRKTKEMLNSIENIMKELKKLEDSNSFKGVYYNVHAFNELQYNLCECINLIEEDNKK